MPVFSAGAGVNDSVDSDVFEYSNSNPTKSRPAPNASPRTWRLTGVVFAPMNAVMSARDGAADARHNATVNPATRTLLMDPPVADISMKPRPIGLARATTAGARRALQRRTIVQRRAAIWLAGVSCVALQVMLSADTLVMRDGRRVQGELIAVRDGTIEFEGQRGLFGGRERVHVDRAEVVRIELDDQGRSDYRSDQGDRNHDSYSSGSSRPSGMRERDVSVSASDKWTDTGVSVRAGQTVYFSASGRVRWGPGRQDGPAGERNSPHNDGRPMASRPAAALIGRVGDSDNYFFIGDDTAAIRVRDSGRLYLGTNDDYLQDNSGSFRVTVYY